MDSTTLKRMAGYLGFAAALPLAIIGATLPVNEFRAQGFAALDCDGPIEVAIFAVPALLIYGTGALLFSRDAPKPRYRLAALCCVLVAGAVAFNLIGAARETCRNTVLNECA